MARQLDFYFDCSSPWTYLAFHAVQPLAAELGAEIAWKPILVGGVFNAVNQTVYDSRAKPNPLKQAYMLKDLADWARLYGLRIVFPPKVFPVNSVKCMRGAFVALDEGKLVPYATAAFEAYWGDDRDISQRGRCWPTSPTRAGLERQRFFAGIETDVVQGAAARQHRRADRARRLRQPDDVRRQCRCSSATIACRWCARRWRRHERQQRSRILGQGARPSGALWRRASRR